MASLPFDQYSPGPFADIAATPFGRQFWAYISDERRICNLIAEARKGEPPVRPLLDEIRRRFGNEIESLPFETDRVKTMCLNMCKQILESHGFVHAACVKMPEGSIFEKTGLFIHEL